MNERTTKEELMQEINRLIKERDEIHRLYVSADTAARAWEKSSFQDALRAEKWELKAREYRFAFLFVLGAIFVAMAGIIGAAIYFK